MNDRFANESNSAAIYLGRGEVDDLEGEDSAVVSHIIQRKTARVIEQDKHLVDVLLSSSSDDDERENVREQRMKFKNHMLGMPAVSATDPIVHPQLSSSDKIVDESTHLALFEGQHEPRIIVITIEDFSFGQSEIVAAVGDVLLFKLTDAVPFHAEHLLHGESDVAELCFESPVLQVTCCQHQFLPRLAFNNLDIIQVKETREYSFRLEVIGEIHVCCSIYSEMFCKVTVSTGTDALLSIAQHSPAAETFDRAVEGSDSSFFDSDDQLSAESFGSEQFPDHHECRIQEDESLVQPLLQEDDKEAAVQSGSLKVSMREPMFDSRPVFHVPAAIVGADEVYVADEQENDEDKLEDDARFALRRDIKANQAVSSNQNRGLDGSINSPVDKVVNRSWDVDDMQRPLHLYGSFLSMIPNQSCNQDDPSRNLDEEKRNDLPGFSFEECKERDQKHIQLSSDLAFLLDSDEEKDTTIGKSLGLNARIGPSSSKTAKKRRNQRKNKKGKLESAERDPSNDCEILVEEGENNNHATNLKASEPKQVMYAFSAEEKVDEYQDSTAVIEIVAPVERTESEASDNDDPIPSTELEDQYVVMNAISQHSALENNIFEKLDLASLYSLFDVDDVEAYLAEREQKIEAEFVPVTNPRKLQRKKAQNLTQDQQSKIVKEQTTKIASKALPKRQRASDSSKNSRELKGLSKVAKHATCSEIQKEMILDEGSSNDQQQPREALTKIKEIQALDNGTEVATEANLFINVANESHPSTIIDHSFPSSAASVSCECTLESPRSISTTDPSVSLTALPSAEGNDENTLSESAVQIERATSESPSCDRRSQLLSVLGLKELISKNVIEEVLGLKSSLPIPVHDPVCDQDTASLMQLSCNEVECEPGCAFFLQSKSATFYFLSDPCESHCAFDRTRSCSETSVF